MEFEDEDHDSDQEEEQEQSIPITTPPPPLPFSASPTPRRPTGAAVRYRECLKNHAVSIGGHAVDGCGEFMAAGEDGTLDALRCAACNCHRNFHRRDTDGNPAATPHRPTLYPHFYRPPAPPGYLHVSPTGVHPGSHVYQHRPPPPLALPSTSGGAHSREEMDDVSNPGSSGGGGTGKKRSRTKFTAEQKEKMAEFAERLGWRIQKHDEEAVQRFCAEVHVQRHVLKVWMHNNKNTLGKKPS